MTAPTAPVSIDLNCDLGESNDPAQKAADLALLDLVSSANIACGGHAGDDATMDATVEAALVRGVALGAHPGYPDRANFGRVALDMPPEAIEASVYQQIAKLGWIARVCGAGEDSAAGGGCGLSHVKLHGALYHKAMHDEPTALAVAAAVRRFEPWLTMVAMPRTFALRLWREQGFTVAVEAFADRAYEPDGSLRSRTLPGSLITDPAAAANQALRLARARIPIDGPHTLCIHSDTPAAATIAAMVRNTLTHAGFTISPPA
jgi:UPF0271 protein